jgi:phosphatidylserine/phosphatidylglycerophosphate/cardiolipin synthase-like enzyme
MRRLIVTVLVAASALISMSASAGARGVGAAPQKVPRAQPSDGLSPLASVAAYLNSHDPGTENRAWWPSNGNALPSDWLLQMPNCWGESRCGQPPPGTPDFLETIRSMLAGAQQSVDIGGLYQPPDGQFMQAIAAGLGADLRAGRSPMVRIMIGIYPFAKFLGVLLYPLTSTTPSVQIPAADYESRLAREILSACQHPGPPGFALPRAPLPTCNASLLRIEFTYMRTSYTNSWDHEKVLDVDGRRAVVGGMNYWTPDYLLTGHPVDDISMQLRGPAAGDVLKFDDILWGWRCSHYRPLFPIVYLRVSSCVSHAPALAPVSYPDGVSVMTVGRLGNGINVPGEGDRESTPIAPSPMDGNECGKFFSSSTDTNTNRRYEYRNPGEDALRALIASANRSIFLSQQDLFSCLGFGLEPKFDERVFEALGTQIARRVPIKIVLSAGRGGSGASGGYDNGYSLAADAQTLTAMVQAQQHVSYDQARSLVCRDVGLAFIHNGAAAKWADGYLFANHAKLVEVDDSAFYIGSENLYPARLQELGWIVESPTAAAQLRASYLDPLWRYSAPYALIDPATSKCGSFVSGNNAPTAALIKVRNTGSGSVEVHWDTLQGDSFTRTRDYPSDFSTADAANGSWQLFGNLNGAPELGFIKVRNTGSGNVEVHWDTLQGNSYKRAHDYTTDFSTADADNGSWQLFGNIDGTPELGLVQVSNTTATQVHWDTLQMRLNPRPFHLAYVRAGDYTSDFNAADTANGFWQLL